MTAIASTIVSYAASFALLELKEGLQKTHGFQDGAFGNRVALDDYLGCKFFGLRMLRLLSLFLILFFFNESVFQSRFTVKIGIFKIPLLLSASLFNVRKK